MVPCATFPDTKSSELSGTFLAAGIPVLPLCGPASAIGLIGLGKSIIPVLPTDTVNI